MLSPDCKLLICHLGAIVDEGSVLFEWGKNLVLAAFGLLLWYFKRSQDSIDKRLDGHDEDIDEQRHNMQQYATRPELEKLRESTEAKHTELERDVKNLGQQLSEVVRREVDTLRTEQQRQHQSMNERLDKLLLLFTKNGGPN